MSHTIALSLIVATYNRLPELETMLASVLPQIGSKPVEIVIVDDCSNDGSWDWLLANFGSRPGVSCLRMAQNSGPGAARNSALRLARGRYFVPIDSDFVVLPNAVDAMLQAIAESRHDPLLFFPCLQHPGATRLDRFSGDCAVDLESFLRGEAGELIPVVNLGWLKERQLNYPELRAGGEGMLWAAILCCGPARFVDSPVVLYRTDVPGRICTAEYQLANPAAMAEVAEAYADLLRTGHPAMRAMQAQKLLAAGCYRLLAGNASAGRRRLWSALWLGSLPAALALATSLAGGRLFRLAFLFYRTRLHRAYV